MRPAADVFPEGAMTLPLFEPLSEKHERPDEWSGPLGFVIGGFAFLPTRAERDGSLADQYFEAASALIDAIWTSASRTIRWRTPRCSYTGTASSFYTGQAFRQLFERKRISIISVTSPRATRTTTRRRAKPFPHG